MITYKISNLKKAVIAVATLFALTTAHAQYTTMVSADGTLLFPTAETFRDQNDVASYSDQRLYPRVVIDCTPIYSRPGETLTSDYSLFLPIDAELKVFDTEDLELKYFVSTSRGSQYVNVEPGSYLTNSATDPDVNIYFTTNYFASSNSYAPDQRAPIPFFWDTYEDIPSQLDAMGCFDYVIDSIIIEPNIDGNTRGGDAISEIFNGTQQPVTLKISLDDVEKNSNNNYGTWRATNVNYYKNKIKQNYLTHISVSDDGEIITTAYDGSFQFADATTSSPGTGWGKGDSATISKITSDLPSGYTSGLSLTSSTTSTSTTSLTSAYSIYLSSVSSFIKDEGVYAVQMWMKVPTVSSTNNYFRVGTYTSSSTTSNSNYFNSIDYIQLNSTNFTSGVWKLHTFIVSGNANNNSYLYIQSNMTVYITGLKIVKL